VQLNLKGPNFPRLEYGVLLEDSMHVGKIRLLISNVTRKASMVLKSLKDNNEIRILQYYIVASCCTFHLVSISYSLTCNTTFYKVLSESSRTVTIVN
jgi:hypothetical protein